MPSPLLFVLLFTIGLAGLISAYFTKRWPEKWRYGMLVLASGLLVLAGYFDPWWKIGEWDDARDVILLLAANAVVIARIKQDARSGKPEAQRAERSDPPAVALVAVILATMFFVRSITHHQSLIRILVLGGLLLVIGTGTYMNRSRQIPKREVLVMIAWVVIIFSLIARFAHR